ncbi:hypothetical protein C0993_000738 [Termitomyces sp. T159_Od127]|nr:hypothetical protein C0993_000738 [Termitomyces sp. T159_Od127]
MQGARSSNKAAALDYQAALSQIREEMGNLRERCGTMTFAFFTRRHVHDRIIPGWIESQGSLAFLNEVLDVTPAVLFRKFELWACAKDSLTELCLSTADSTILAKTVDTMASLRSECVNLISGGLRKCIVKSPFPVTGCHFAEKIVGVNNVTMFYEKYDVEVVERHSVVLRGWPEGLQFRSPAKITVMEDARVLRDALVSGECMWVKSKAAGTQEVKCWKETVSPEADLDDEANGSEASEKEPQPPKKRARKSGGKKGSTASKLPPIPKSSEFVDTDTDGDDE